MPSHSVESPKSSSSQSKKKWILLLSVILLLLVALPISSKFFPEDVRPTEMASLYVKQWLYRILPPPESELHQKITLPTIESSMRSGADWILKMQEPQGRFQYWYHPKDNAYSRKTDDNFLRQAGTAFSLTMIYETTKDPRYLEGAKKNLAYLNRFKKDLGSDKSYYFFRRKAKLGGAALTMMAMLHVKKLTGTVEYDELLRRLGEFVLFLQEPYKTGQFKSTYVYRGDYEYEKNSGWESRIYPGEAMLALAFMYEQFGDVKYKESIDRAVAFYSNDDLYDWQSYAFLPWTITAMVSMYEQTQEAHYSEFALKLSDYLLVEQNLDPQDVVYGSFHVHPGANTGSYLEGLGDAIRHVRQIGDKERETLYTERLKMGFQWVLKLQYDKERVDGLKHPDRALGGFHKNMRDATLRIDYTQHIITSMSKAILYSLLDSEQITKEI